MTDILLLAFIFLAAGVVAVPVAARLGLGSVLGYLIAGILLSPLLALLGVDVTAIQAVAEFGVVMMLFLVGLEVQPRALWDMRGQLIGLGGGQVVGSALVVMAAAMALGQPWTVALAIGLVLSVSSTAIVLQTLGEKGLLKSDGGRASFAVLLSQDIAVIPMLAFLPLLALPELAALGGEAARDGGALSLVEGLTGWQTALVNLLAIAGVVVGGSTLSGPLFRFIAAANLRELFTATALMLVIGIALLMMLVGLSPALGAFLGGVVLANSAYRHELESDIDPFRGLLLGLFFITVGAGINFGLLAENAALILGLTVGLIALKALAMLVVAYALGLRGPGGWLVALGLAQAGEFGFVLLNFTVANDVLPPALAELLLLVVALSMMLTPGLFILYDRVIAPRYASGAERAADAMPEGGKIIIAGAGRVGGLIYRVLRAAGHEATVIDFSSHRLAILERFGTKHYYGDATRPDLLQAAGLPEAQVLVVAIDDREGINTIVRYVTKTFPHVHVTARALDRDHTYDLWAFGCRDIIRETYDSTLRMSRSVFEAMGIGRDRAEDMVAAFNARDRRAMVMVADVHEVGVPPHENAAYIAKVRELRGAWEDQTRAEMDAAREGRAKDTET